MSKFILTLVLLCSVAVIAKVDYDVMRKELSKLQSAIDKEDEKSLVQPLIKMIDMIPSQVHHYMIGLTTGAHVGLTYQSTSHLTGSHHSMPLNVWRDYNEDCVHVVAGIEGLIVLVTGKNETFKACEYSYVFGSPSGYSKVVSYGQNIDVFSTLKANATESALAVHTKFIESHKGYPIAISLQDFNYVNFPTSAKIHFLFGHVAENCHGSHCFSEFRVYGKTRFDPMSKKFTGHVNQIEKCSQCFQNLGALFNSTMDF